MIKYLLIILLFVNVFLYSEKNDEKTVINSLGQAVLTETYKNDPDGLYKIDWYYKNKSTGKENLIQSILYFRDNIEYKEKQLDSYKEGKKIMSTCYFLENNPNYSIKSIEKSEINGFITNIYYSEKEPTSMYLTIFYDDLNKKTLKQEIFFKNNKDKAEKVIRYFDKTNEINEEIYFLEGSKNNCKIINRYYYDFDKKTRKHEEVNYYPNKNYLVSSIYEIYPNGVIQEQTEQFEENHFNYVKIIAKWDESGAMTELKYYDKAGNEVKPE